MDFWALGLFCFITILCFIAFLVSESRMRKMLAHIDSISLPEKDTPCPVDLERGLDDFFLRMNSVIESRFDGLGKKVEGIPSKTLNTIQGSINTTTGKLGEIIQYLELQKSYDRFIVLGDIVDFIGIKFSNENSPGVIELVDVKTGKRAALSEDQKQLRNLVEAFNKQLPKDLAPLIVFKVVRNNLQSE
jgi:predicted Holliday junction resolvase-like endonuclease